MILVSWNVNGLRSTEKAFLKFIDFKSPDILMIQELRAHPDQLNLFLKMISGYHVEFNPADRPGYSGTAFYYKDSLPIESVTSKTGKSILDKEGRVNVCKIGNTYIINFYTPNGTGSEKRLKYKLRYYTEMNKYLKELLLKGFSVIVGGDLNVCPTEDDLYNPKGNLRKSGFLPEERKWFSGIIKLGFVDTFRMFTKGPGHYTWWHMRDPKRKKNRGWRFDYFLVSKNLKKNVKHSKILKDIFGSDHCPIELDLKI